MEWPYNVFEDIGIEVKNNERMQKEIYEARLLELMDKNCHRLTKAEKEVFRNIYVMGLTVEETAEKLSRTKETVSCTLKHIIRFKGESIKHYVMHGRDGEITLRRAEEGLDVRGDDLKQISLYNFCFLACDIPGGRLARTRLNNFLWRNGIWNLWQLSRCSMDQIMSLKGFGESMKQTLMLLLERFGIKLKEESDFSEDEGAIGIGLADIMEKHDVCTWGELMAKEKELRLTAIQNGYIETECILSKQIEKMKERMAEWEARKVRQAREKTEYADVRGYLNFVYANGRLKAVKEEIEEEKRTYVKRKIHSRMSGEEFVKYVKDKTLMNQDGRIGFVLVDGFLSNLGLYCNGFIYGGFPVDKKTFLGICARAKVEVDWVETKVKEA